MMNEAFQRFEGYLRDRFERGTFTTEDSVRYTLFHALSETISPAQIIVEAPHPTISGKRVDLVAPLAPDGALLAIEFKYDRRAKMNAPMPMKAGALIHDFVRMAALPEHYRARYVVYVTDDEMHGYFERSALRTKMSFYGAVSGTECFVDDALLAEQSATLRNRAALTERLCVTVVHAARLPAHHNLRVFSVSTAPAADTP